MTWGGWIRAIPWWLRVSILSVAVWLLAAVLTACLIHFGLNASNRVMDSRLVKHGIAVTATVTRTEPNDHNTVYYTFQASGHAYYSSNRSDPPNPEAARLHPGDRLSVVYDSTDPTISCACNPKQMFKSDRFINEFAGGLYVGVVAPVALVVILSGRRTRSQGPARRPPRPTF